MTLRQSHFVAPVPLVLGQHRGLIDDRHVITTRTRGSEEQFAGLMSGEIDVVITAMDNLFEWTRRGVNVRLVGQAERTTPLGLHVRAGIDSVADLEGKRFGVDALANGFSLVARQMLGSVDETVSYVEVGGVRERMEALLAGQIDATLLGPPFDRLGADTGTRKLLSVESMLPEFPGQGIVVRTELVGTEELDSYLAALARGVSIGRALPDAEGIAILRDYGFGAASEDMWRVRPMTLHVAPQGLALLTRIRADLGYSVDGVDLSALCAEPTVL
ncbi:MAG: ABC transporter substrate-binding protein [Gulosibacter sp.]|uniref:ABC transporter substrate-binding protein n=1 Tax=Gulosibacter sp. TaxID=2817531 RepID=UPI003F9316BF